MVYKNEKTKNISFPLGGIGTGCIGLAGNGELIDWEIFNRPSKGTRNGYSHFAIKAVCHGKTYTKVLHGDTNESYIGGHDRENPFAGFGFGPHTNSMAGFPHFKDVTFDGEFPIAKLRFEENTFPCVAKLTAFNPFIPHDPDNSSLPVAMLEWEIENTTDQVVDYTLALAIQNPSPKSRNSEVAGAYKGISLVNGDKEQNEIGYFDLCALVDDSKADVEGAWYRGGWQDGVTTYWKNLTLCENLPARTYETDGYYDHGALASHFTLNGGECKRVRFVIAWNVPNQYCYWDSCKDDCGKETQWKNHYATKFKSSQESAEYAMSGFDTLFSKTDEFCRAIHDSTLPHFVIDAISANLSVLKTPVTLRLENGELWGWEGLNQTGGSCEGSCQHVWNYAYAVPFLFPQLERTLRESTMKYAWLKGGGTAFRVQLPLGRAPKWHRSCVDGQMGEVIKCFREWKISGNTSWLEANCEKIFAMLEFAWSPENDDCWDRDMDGVLEGRQHHTLDMELFGPSSWLQGFYLLALDCGAQMAESLGLWEKAKKYREVYEKGKKWTNENLFNGRYFYQNINLNSKSILDAYPETESYWNDEAKEIKYQIGNGCIIDQMLSDWHAHLIGQAGVFDEEKKKIALKSLYENNYKGSMREITNMWRNFSLNDEGGAIICSYPNGVTAPSIPIPYCEETMTGFEYALAGLLIAEGFVTEGESIVKSIRHRYDGEKRNPWNEIECGSNYARSMASFALMIIYSGFSYDMTARHIGFAPIKNGRYLWSVGNTWGVVSLTETDVVIDVKGDECLTLSTLFVPRLEMIKSVLADGKELSFAIESNKLLLNSTFKRLQIAY